MNAQTYFFTCAFLFSLILPSCGSESKQNTGAENDESKPEIVTLTKESIAGIGLTHFTVEPRVFTGELIIPAKVLPNQNLESHVGSLIQGRVHRIFVNVGDFVAAEQILMTVEGLDVGAMKAGFIKAKAAFEYAKAAYDRQKKLFDEKIGSQKAFLESQAEYEKARAEYNAEDRRIHSIGLSDEDVANGKAGEEHTSGTLPIKSHISGVVIERNVVLGQFVDAATNAFKVINTRSMWIDGQMYEKDLAKIGQKTAAFFATTTYPQRKFTGQIIYLGQVVDEQSRTITVRGEFLNPQNRLKPHMFGELIVPIASNTKMMMIPEEAVVKEAGEDYTFVLTSDTTFEKRNVVTGTAAGALIEIKKGLTEGEKVVAKGVFYLKSELKKDELGGE